MIIFIIKIITQIQAVRDYFVTNNVLTSPKFLSKTDPSHMSSHFGSASEWTLLLLASSTHLMRCNMSCLYFFCCLGPPSTTTTFTSPHSTVVPVMNNCLAFVSTLNLCEPLLRSVTLRVYKITLIVVCVVFGD